MQQVYPVREEKQGEIPAVTHVDGTGQLQAVGKDRNPVYHTLISAFAGKTGTPVVLNTSFNENEPIVESPEQALDCFFRTATDAVVVENGYGGDDGDNQLRVRFGRAVPGSPSCARSAAGPRSWPLVPTRSARDRLPVPGGAPAGRTRRGAAGRTERRSRSSRRTAPLLSEEGAGESAIMMILMPLRRALAFRDCSSNR